MQTILILLITIIYFTFFPKNLNPAFAQTPDSLHYQENTTSESNPEPDVADDHFSPGQFALLLIFLGVILFFVGIALVVTMAFLLVIFGLVSFGLLTASVIIGLYNKSVSGGFRALVVLASATGGMFSGGAALWVINKIMHWITGWQALLIGSGLGLIGGVIFGFLAVYLLRRISLYFKTRLSLT